MPEVGRPERLIVVPALITLAVTLLRLTGELLHWSPALFNPEAGGGGALVGISWLPPLFGLYFAFRLAQSGHAPGPLGRGFGLVLLAVALVPVSGAFAAAAGVDQQSLAMLSVYIVASVVAIPIAVRAWPALGRTLLAYAFAARIPVVVVMLLAILGNWGTHYDVPPSADFPAMGPWAKWFWIGLLPQMTVWIAYTVVIGALVGIGMGALVARRRPATA